MKKILHAIYRRVVCQSCPVTDAATGRKEIATYTEVLGFVISVTYKSVSDKSIAENLKAWQARATNQRMRDLPPHRQKWLTPANH